MLRLVGEKHSDMKVTEIIGEATKGGFGGSRHIGKSSGGSIWGTSSRLSRAMDVNAKPKIPQLDPNKPKPSKIIDSKLVALKKKWAEEDRQKER